MLALPKIAEQPAASFRCQESCKGGHVTVARLFHLMSSYRGDCAGYATCIHLSGNVYIARAVKDITFLDDNLRITRGGDGSLFVLEKEGDTGAKW